MGESEKLRSHSKADTHTQIHLKKTLLLPQFILIRDVVLVTQSCPTLRAHDVSHRLAYREDSQVRALVVACHFCRNLLQQGR